MSKVYHLNKPGDGGVRAEEPSAHLRAPLLIEVIFEISISIAREENMDKKCPPLGEGGTQRQAILFSHKYIKNAGVFDENFRYNYQDRRHKMVKIILATGEEKNVTYNITVK